MIRFFTLTLFVVLTLDARENPFFPAKGEVDIPLTTNQKTTIPPLKQASLELPSTARTVESISIEYKNLDGSLAKKSISLGNSIDWHLPLFITQNYGNEGVSHKSLKEKFHLLAKLKFISFYESTKRLKLITQDKMIRNFLLVKPHRIVCDFKRDIDIRSYQKNLEKKGSIVKRVRVGNHKGYYRVVIELDGFYRYETQRIAHGYSFNLL